MSRENVEVVRHLVAGWAETGEPLWELLDPEVTLTTRGDVVGRQTYTGFAGVSAALASFRHVWERIGPEVVELRHDDQAVAALLRFRNRSHSGVAVEGEEGWTFWLDSGLIRRIEQYATLAEALEAAGLSG